ncbi:MAG TPA: hypothetical protein VFJ85_12275 [Acidimicrobiales bacterium]|nr:hypothetical protein [Acidimicrobiales bacterium]
MTFQGGDPGALRHLVRLLDLDAAELLLSRRAIEPILTEVCVATTAGADIGRVIDEVFDAIGAVTRAVHALEAPPPQMPIGPVLPGPPTTLPGPDCKALEQDVGTVVDEMVRRFHQVREDARNLRVLRPKGPFSYEGHHEQIDGKQTDLDRRIEKWADAGCTDSLTVEIGRMYAQMDARAELNWPAASAIAAHAQHRGWWHVDLPPIGRVAAGVAAAAGAVAAAAKALGGAAVEAAPALA